MIWKAAWALDHPEAVADRSVADLPLHVIARVYTAEAVNDVALLAAECFGAMGVMRDMPLQKYVHDAGVSPFGRGPLARRSTPPPKPPSLINDGPPPQRRGRLMGDGGWVKGKGGMGDE